MPGYWCSGCNDYHHTEDEDDEDQEEDEDAMPAQTQGFPGYMWRVDSRGIVIEYSYQYTDSNDDCFWLTCDNPERVYARTSNRAAERVMQSFLAEQGRLPCQAQLAALAYHDEDAEGCNGRNWRWVGQYTPISRVQFPRDGTRLVAAGPAMSCPHCAMRVAQVSGATLQTCGPIGPHGLDLLLPELVGEPARTPANYATTTNGGAIGTCCATCGFPGHNSRSCPKEFKFYDKVGIEIEGRWHDISEARRAAGDWSADTTGDGSISRSFATAASSMEIRTNPGTISHALKQLLALYPDETDSSCGMHVHISFADPLFCTQLMTNEFFEYFRGRFAAWGEAQGFLPSSNFFKRLRGENSFCQINTVAADPFNVDRYRQLNFSAWHSHKTLECRLLPMFRDSRHGVSAVLELMDIIHTWVAGAAEQHGASLPAHECSAVDMPEVFAVDNAFPIDTGEGAVSVGEFSLEIPDLPPLDAGMRRVAVTQDTLNALRALRLVA